MNKMSQRNYGIDLLRIIAMYMVVVSHVLKHGGILAATEELTLRYEVAWLLEIAAMCSVNCYALISGYVGIEAKYKYTNIIVLWLRVVWYTIFITLICNVVIPEKIGFVDYVKAAFPISTEQYWYFNAYLAVFILIPVLNHAVNTMKKTEFRAILIVLITIYSVMQTVIHKDVMGTAYGYSGLWLMILYMIGAYIRKYEMMRNVSTRKALCGYVCMVLLTWSCKFVIEHGTSWLFEGQTKGGNFLVNYTSPTMLGAAFFLVIGFEKLKLNVRIEKIVSIFSPLAFSVYLIHVHPLVWSNFLQMRYADYVSLPIIYMIIAILVTSFGIYMICSMVDFIRNFIFNKINVGEQIKKIGKNLRISME